MNWKLGALTFLLLGILSCSDGPQVPAAIRALRVRQDPNSPASVLSRTRSTFVLWQLSSQGPAQNQSYVMLTVNGRVLVVDGGWGGEDADYLRAFISVLGNRVHVWVVSHPHSDHTGALKEILQSPGGITIDRIYSSLNTAAWTSANEPSSAASINSFLGTLQGSSVPKTEPALGDIVVLDGVSLRFLSVKNPELLSNAVNNSSLVTRIWDSTKSVLFLGDMGAEGGNKLLASSEASNLPSTYVQMAHHGQAGVTRAFYQAVNPRYCLWPTPLWLWNNDRGGGPGSGPWQTLAVRGWTDTLSVETHFVSYRGLMKIE